MAALPFFRFLKDKFLRHCIDKQKVGAFKIRRRKIQDIKCLNNNEKLILYS